MTKVYIVVGLGFGDEGKGSWVDHLVRKHGLRYVVRFNGGAQALHHVHTPEGVVHGFSQFGSGAFVPGTYTVLSRFMLVEPMSMLYEAKKLESKGVIKPLSRQIISENAPVITPFHVALNRIKETERGEGRHGSCGFGIGETQKDIDECPEESLYMKDLYVFRSHLLEKVTHIYERKLQEAQQCSKSHSQDLLQDLLDFDLDEYVDDLRDFAGQVSVVSDYRIQNILSENDTVFEGAQGVLLDQRYGFFPYCTRSNATFQNALELLEGVDCEIVKVGLLRAYSTRHGAGPFVAEDKLPVSSCDNGTGPWQGVFRNGWFDAVAARFALKIVGGVDVLALTNVDRLFGLDPLKIVTNYSGDAGFFPQGEMAVFADDLSRSADRSQAMMEIVRTEKSLVGFATSDDPSLQAYFEAIEAEIGRSIDVFSVTPGLEQVYRN